MGIDHHKFKQKHFIGIEHLSLNDLTYLLDKAQRNIDISRQVKKKKQSLSGYSVFNLFFEPSTRTQSSFELAAKRLGADVLNLSVESLSLKKGETLIDTATTLNAMQPDVLVIRHSMAGAVHLLTEKVGCSVINAGDGAHEHPTQALLDALTILRYKGAISGLKIAICGDVLHSRVVRSNILLLKKLGAHINLVAPSTLLPATFEDYGVSLFHSMKAGLADCDIVMMLRVQHERMKGVFLASVKEYHRTYGLDREKLAYAKKDALVMHPGPINRGVEISSEIADGAMSLINQQVEMGIAVRMAVLEAIVEAGYSKKDKHVGRT